MPSLTRFTPLEDSFLVDSRTASRRPWPSCRSPHRVPERASKSTSVSRPQTPNPHAHSTPFDIGASKRAVSNNGPAPPASISSRCSTTTRPAWASPRDADFCTVLHLSVASSRRGRCVLSTPLLVPAIVTSLPGLPLSERGRWSLHCGHIRESPSIERHRSVVDARRQACGNTASLPALVGALLTSRASQTSAHRRSRACGMFLGFRRQALRCLSTAAASRQTGASRRRGALRPFPTLTPEGARGTVRGRILAPTDWLWADLPFFYRWLSARPAPCFRSVLPPTGSSGSNHRIGPLRSLRGDDTNASLPPQLDFRAFLHRRVRDDLPRFRGRSSASSMGFFSSRPANHPLDRSFQSTPIPRPVLLEPLHE